MKNKNLQPFSAAAYRAQVAETVKLPSGAIFALRRPSIAVYLKNGRLPEELFKKIFGQWKTIEKLSESEAEKAVVKEFSDAEVEKLLLFQADVVADACVSPRIVIDADGSKDDELNPNELTQEDYLFIFKWAIARGGVEANSLGKFRR